MAGVPNVPADLKAIAPFLQRASELRAREPVVAYYCDYYAARMALEKMEQGSRSKEVQEYLYALMDRLEQEKKSLSNREEMTDDVVAKAYIENFALKIFLNADNEDRAGKASKKTAKTFLAASMFLELLKIFGDVDEEIYQKMKYARWKTADIIKAINEGRTPEPGPPGGDELDGDTQMQEYEPNGGSSTQDFGFRGSEDGEFRNVSPDGGFGRVSPAVPSTSSAPPPPDFPSFPDPPSLRPDSAAGRPSQPSAPAASLPIAPATTAATGVDYSAQKMQASGGGAYTYDPKVLTNAQKHARFAISAIQYDDIETAVDNLQKALKYLEPYLKR